MVRGRAVAVGAALLLFGAEAGAQELSERVRLQAGYIGEERQSPAPYVDDFVATAIPEVSLFWGDVDSRSNLTYQLTGSLRTQAGASELSHRLLYEQATRLGRRTTLFLNASANQSTLSNLLVTTPLATGVTGTVLPGAGVKIVSGNVGQTLQHELSPLLLLNQSSGVFATTTLAPTAPLDTLTAELGGSLERLFTEDALGAETRISYVTARSVPPIPDRDYVFAEAGPRWRHDWSRTISSRLNVGATVLLTEPQTVYPSGRASVLYSGPSTSRGPGMPAMGVTVNLSASTGIVPSPLTGIATRTHLATLLAGVPVSMAARLSAIASLSVAHADLIDPTNTLPAQAYDSIISDVSLEWSVTDRVQAFARYQFVGQIGDRGNLSPSFLRDTVLLGVTFSSSPPGANAVARGPAQRVDQNDIPAASISGVPEAAPGAADDDWGRRTRDAGVDDGSSYRAPGSPPPVLPALEPRPGEQDGRARDRSRDRR